MPRMPRVNGNEILRALKQGGWYVDDVQGSHHHLRHRDRPGKVTVAIHGNRTIDPWVLNKILQQANMTADEFRALL